jgi:peptidase M28-like protein
VVASAHLARLGAVSRATGSREIADARQYCAALLGELGFSVAEHPFEFSAFAGRWAAPVAGLLIPSLATLIVLARSPQSRALWIAAGGVLFALWLLIGRWSSGRGVLDAPLLRRRGVNLEAVRGAEPRLWLLAHLDSKWQPVPMIARVAGVLTLGVSLIALAGAIFLVPPAVPWLLALTWLGATPLILSLVGARNHGTLDNASGVAAVLTAAALVEPSQSLGVLITDAEELALAGARAWASEGRIRPTVAINCDTVDDDGPLVLMYTGSRPMRVISALEAAASSSDVEVRALHLIPGILTDSIALAARGWETVTLSRGTLRTLQRIHTSRDTLATMSGKGIEAAAIVLARAATELG